jgi:hypothetical protein
MRRVVRQLAHLFLAALCPGLAFALSETYEGQLIPITNDSPISIVVQVENVGGFLSGKISTSFPLKYTSTIDAGRNVAGYCNLAAALSSNITLRLSGDCGRTVFEGKYAIYYNQPKRIARGTFRLTRKIVDAGKGTGLTGTESSASLVVACSKANTRCLAGCPRGDTDVEYLCANRCRTKMQACKGKANKIESDLE